MGCMHTGPQQVFLFDDRVLAHLRSVIFSKLGLQESFVFTWNDSGAQRSIWMHPAMGLQFEHIFTGIGVWGGIVDSDTTVDQTTIIVFEI